MPGIQGAGEEICPDYGVLNANRMHHVECTALFLTLHLFEERILVREREWHYLEIPKTTEGFAGKGRNDLHGMGFPTVNVAGGMSRILSYP